MRSAKITVLFLSVGLVVGLAACAPSPTPTATAMPAAPTAISAPVIAASPTGAPLPEVTSGPNGEVTGADLYLLSCAPCHGADRGGNTFDVDGQSVSVPELAWNDLNKMYQSDPSRGTVSQQLELAITKGLDETGDELDPMMPHWGSVLSQAQVESIIAYLQTTNMTGGAPTLTATAYSLQGGQLFHTACAACHGADAAGKDLEAGGDTITTPSLQWSGLNQMYAADPSRGTVAQQVALAITQGQDETGDGLNPMMPRWSILSQEQVDSIVQYLQTTSQ